MLTQEQNERLTRVGPGTPMGDLLRRYWYPVATDQQLGENPVRAFACSVRTLPCSGTARVGWGSFNSDAPTGALT